MSVFSKQLVLNQWLLNQLGVDKLNKLSEWLHHKDYIGFNDEGNSRFFVQLSNRLLGSKTSITQDQLMGYDENIVHHWKQITEPRNRAGQTLYPLYFQYIALLFNEIYQDFYWRDSAKLCDALNQFLPTFNKPLKKAEQVESYQESDLNKLAFWMATGAGKTLLMHANILQTNHYLKKYNKQKSIEQSILLTPNARLSEQHYEELRSSGINASLYSKNLSTPSSDIFGQAAILILDIHKLKDKDGDTTVAVGNFEGRNLVFIDEGHRGASGEDWLDKREQLCEYGFSYEYSATFEQAIAGASTTKNKETKVSPQQRLTQLYAKCILLDYSYRYFYNDGFGKDSHILNLEESKEQEQQRQYLTACMMAFFQQRLLYKDEAPSIKPYLLDNPLCLFVGGTVTGKELGEQQSDVVAIVQFLSDFLNDRLQGEFLKHIDHLLHAREDLLNKKNQRVFDGRFTYLFERFNQKTPEEFYKALRLSLFNTANGGLLHIDELKGTDGEIGLRVGEAKEYFGVINIGDTPKLMKVFEAERSKQERPGFVTGNKIFSGSLFRDINTDTSSVTFLIGAKKFTEGWSSWRVGTMGLMNIGKNKGSEIIQLFGRGVRLKGYDFGLQRSGFVVRDDGESHPDYLHYLETLNVFGVKAKYMEEFQQLLEDQGLGEEDKLETKELPVVPSLSSEQLAQLDLKLLRPSPDAPKFKQTKRPSLNKTPPTPHTIHVVVDWYPRVNSFKTKSEKQLKLESQRPVQVQETVNIGPRERAFIDFDALLFEALRFKNEKSWHNLQIHKNALIELFQHSDWYTLKLPKVTWQAGEHFEKVILWQELALVLLKKYCERFYLLTKQEHEAPFLSYQTVQLGSKEDPNYIEKYVVEYPAIYQEFGETLDTAKSSLMEAKETLVEPDLKGFGELSFLSCTNHLYFPLIHIAEGSNRINVKPVGLNSGESAFIQDLQLWSNKPNNLSADTELYVLRNQSKTGIGFFDAGNFYPDFIVWLRNGNKQWISFVDPKGLLHNTQGLKNPKIQFHKTIKEYQDQYKGTAKDKEIVLNSFILSTTEQRHLKELADDFTFDQHHVLFQEDPDYIVKMMGNVMKP